MNLFTLKIKKNKIKNTFYCRLEDCISDRNYRFPIGNLLIPIRIMDFRLEIHYFDPEFSFFLTFNYKKVPLKTKVLQLGPNQSFKIYD